LLFQQALPELLRFIMAQLHRFRVPKRGWGVPLNYSILEGKKAKKALRSGDGKSSYKQVSKTIQASSR
jgi:hypothetical protein